MQDISIDHNMVFLIVRAGILLNLVFSEKFIKKQMSNLGF